MANVELLVVVGGCGVVVSVVVRGVVVEATVVELTGGTTELLLVVGVVTCCVVGGFVLVEGVLVVVVEPGVVVAGVVVGAAVGSSVGVVVDLVGALVVVEVVVSTLTLVVILTGFWVVVLRSPPASSLVSVSPLTGPSLLIGPSSFGNGEFVVPKSCSSSSLSSTVIRSSSQPVLETGSIFAVGLGFGRGARVVST